LLFLNSSIYTVSVRGLPVSNDFIYIKSRLDFRRLFCLWWSRKSIFVYEFLYLIFKWFSLLVYCFASGFLFPGSYLFWYVQLLQLDFFEERLEWSFISRWFNSFDFLKFIDSRKLNYTILFFHLVNLLYLLIIGLELMVWVMD